MLLRHSPVGKTRKRWLLNERATRSPCLLPHPKRSGTADSLPYEKGPRNLGVIFTSLPISELRSSVVVGDGLKPCSE